MATYTFVNVDIDESIPLADLNGVALDLESVGLLSKYLTDHLASGKVGMEIVDAFSTAILVRYARSFRTGVRRKIGPDIIATLTPHQRELHENFIAWRNKHIAHSINPFENNQVVAYYNEEKVAEEGIQSISLQQRRLIGLGLQDLVDIQKLAEALHIVVKSRIYTEQSGVLKIIRSRPVGEILASGMKAPAELGIESVKKVRMGKKVRKKI